MTDNSIILQNMESPLVSWLLAIAATVIAYKLISKAVKSWKIGSEYRDEINRMKGY